MKLLGHIFSYKMLETHLKHIRVRKGVCIKMIRMWIYLRALDKYMINI